jgi:hypothetical protein
LLTPDRNIVKKIQEYDPDLYVTWNQKKSWFELWRSVKDTNVRLNQRLDDQLITPITRSIYNTEAPREFVQLDERILWWIYEADSHKKGGSKKMWADDNRAWEDDLIHKHIKKKEMLYDRAKDMYNDVNNFYLGSRYNRRQQKQTGDKMLRPDSTGLTSNRVVARSSGNAKAYNYQRKK